MNQFTTHNRLHNITKLAGVLLFGLSIAAWYVWFYNDTLLALMLVYGMSLLVTTGSGPCIRHVESTPPKQYTSSDDVKRVL